MRMRPYRSKIRIVRNSPDYGSIILTLLQERYQGKRTEDIFDGKDPTTYFRDLRDSKSKKKTF